MNLIKIIVFLIIIQSDLINAENLDDKDHPFDDKHKFEKSYEEYLIQSNLDDHLIPRRRPPYSSSSIDVKFEDPKLLKTRKKYWKENIENSEFKSFIINPSNPEFLKLAPNLNFLSRLPLETSKSLREIFTDNLYRNLNISDNEDEGGVEIYFQIIQNLNSLSVLTNENEETFKSTEYKKEVLKKYSSYVINRSLKDRRKYVKFYKKINLNDWDKTTLEVFDNRIASWKEDKEWMKLNIELTKNQEKMLDNIQKCFEGYSNERKKYLHPDFYSGFYGDYGKKFGKELSKKEYPHNFTFLFEKRMEILLSDCQRISQTPFEILSWTAIVKK